MKANLSAPLAGGIETLLAQVWPSNPVNWRGEGARATGRRDSERLLADRDVFEVVEDTEKGEDHAR
jgi:hypothetical protein